MVSIFAEIDETLDPVRHQVAEIEEGAKDGVVLRVLKTGFMDSEGDILRRVQVVAGKAASVEGGESNETSEDKEENGEEDTKDTEDIVL